MKPRNYAKWTADEDTTLLQLVADGNSRRVQWKQIAACLEKRTPRQCFDRHIYLLREREQRERHCWTEEETEKFVRETQKKPVAWKHVHETFFPHLTLEQVKNKANVMRKQGRRNEMPAEVDELLL